jgi:type II secretion system protein N
LSAIFSFRSLAGNRRLFALCLILFIVSTFISLWLFFPADVVQRRLVQEMMQTTGIKIQGDNASMLFPFGLKLDLAIYPEVMELADLKVNNLHVSPAWKTLLSDSPALNFKGSIADGQFLAQAGQDGRLNINAQDVALLGLQQPGNDYRLSGNLTAELHAEELAADMTGQGRFTIEINDAQVLGLQKIGLPNNFAVGLVQLAGKFNQRRVSVERIVATGGVLGLSGGGTLLVGETPDQTRLNLNLRLYPHQTTPDSLRDMIKLTGIRPTADGSYLLRIGGTLAKPVIR